MERWVAKCTISKFHAFLLLYCSITYTYIHTFIQFCLLFCFILCLSCCLSVCPVCLCVCSLPNVHLSPLQLLEACVKNCGQKFHQELGKFKFLNELIRLISPKVRQGISLYPDYLVLTSGLIFRSCFLYVHVYGRALKLPIILEKYTTNLLAGLLMTPTKDSPIYTVCDKRMNL